MDDELFQFEPTDPVVKILQDFFENCVLENPDGDTKTIDYDYWAKQIDMIYVVKTAEEKKQKRIP